MIREENYAKLISLAPKVTDELKLCQFIAYIRQHKVYSPNTITSDVINRCARTFRPHSSYWVYVDNAGYNGLKYLGRQCNRYIKNNSSREGTMAFITQCLCHTCKNSFQGNAHGGRTPTECGACYTTRTDRERREHFGKLDALTTDERIRNIEEWLYDYRPPRTGPVTYT